MTKTATIATTETGANLDRVAQDRGLALHEAGVVEVLGGTLALIEDGGMFYGADAEGCGCSTPEERDGRACGHQWALYFAQAATGGVDRGTAA